MKYQAFLNDNDIAIDFIEAIFTTKRRTRKITNDKLFKITKEVKRMREEGYTGKQISSELNITQYRIDSIVRDLT